MNLFRNVLFVIALLGILLFLFISTNKNFNISSFVSIISQPQDGVIDQKTAIVSNDRVSLKLEVADTSEKREQGLSGREDLGNFDGMLFVFPELSYQTFWMKDMNFDLDMIWLDEKGTVVQIDRNVKASGYDQENPDLSEKISSRSEIKYVLELNSGKSDLLNIRVGDKFTINY